MPARGPRDGVVGEGPQERKRRCGHEAEGEGSHDEQITKGFPMRTNMEQSKPGRHSNCKQHGACAVRSTA